MARNAQNCKRHFDIFLAPTAESSILPGLDFSSSLRQKKNYVHRVGGSRGGAPRVVHGGYDAGLLESTVHRILTMTIFSRFLLPAPPPPHSSPISNEVLRRSRAGRADRAGGRHVCGRNFATTSRSATILISISCRISMRARCSQFQSIWTRSGREISKKPPRAANLWSRSRESPHRLTDESA